MQRLEFPKPLRTLLDDSDLYGPLRLLADRVGEIAGDNKLPFFPDYTDHGINHIQSVLKSVVTLVPRGVWKQSAADSDPRLLCDADAAVIIGATLLHDLAMHLSVAGFIELVSSTDRFSPLPWFRDSHESHVSDRPWRELWDEYVRDTRRLSERELVTIIGEQSAHHWAFEDLPLDTGEWTRNHFLVIGEFIRRHHARLAHEIAIYGFPGLPPGSGFGQFPALGSDDGHPLMRLADLIGLTARSHGLSLRACKAYLESSPLYPGTPRPMGSAVLYPMALLRVADFLQLDQQRAPAALLRLRNPQSPISVQEWAKHRAVQAIGPASDPRATFITVSPQISLSTYLQLRDLIGSVQREIDHATAVLDEAYGTLTELGLDKLGLSIRRVYSNLTSPAFRDSLPFIPEPAGFTADPALFTLLMQPLYGDHPGVGIRELIQNAADAVIERQALVTINPQTPPSTDEHEQAAQVTVDFIQRADGSWFVRVTDRGIGMRSETLQSYFLRAGASFRMSREWRSTFATETGSSRIARGGRFGIGVFALFLLGTSFRVRTRHVYAPDQIGYSLEATLSSQLIQLTRMDGLPVGTTIEVELSADVVPKLHLDLNGSARVGGLLSQVDWFCWDWPTVILRITADGRTTVLPRRWHVPAYSDHVEPQWASIRVQGYEKILWAPTGGPALSCNGIKVSSPVPLGASDIGRLPWPADAPFSEPRVAVVDTNAQLPLTIQRYELIGKCLPFTDALIRDIALSFIAHALIMVPASRGGAWGIRHPLVGSDGRANTVYRPFASGYLRWCATSTHFAPADPWLYPTLKTNRLLIYGSTVGMSSEVAVELWEHFDITLAGLDGNIAMTSWGLPSHYYGYDDTMDQPWSYATSLRQLGCEGIEAIGTKHLGSVIAIVADSDETVFALRQNDKPTSERVQDAWHIDTIRGIDHVWNAPTGSWSRVDRPGRRRPLLTFAYATASTNLPIDHLVDELDFVSHRDAAAQNHGSLAYVAACEAVCVDSAPESLVASLWNECLGPNAIPFDVELRKALIERGSAHPDLRRHIDAWRRIQAAAF